MSRESLRLEIPSQILPSAQPSLAAIVLTVLTFLALSSQAMFGK
jgi:hypothetical protein